MRTWKPWQIALCVVVVSFGAVAGAIYLVPNRDEMGALYLRAARYDQARPFFQARYARGDRGAPVIAGLAWLHQLDASMNRAIALYENRARKHPGDKEARQRLEWLYGQADRTYDHATAIERRIGSYDNPGDRRIVARAFWRLGRYKDWARQMAHLANARNLTPAEAVRYARYLAAKKDPATAVAVLEKFVLTVRKDEADTNVVRHGALMAIALHLDQKRERRALLVARRAIKLVGTSQFRLAMVDVLDRRNRAPLAIALLEGGDTRKALSRHVLRRLAWLEHKTDRSDKAFARIAKLAENERLHAEDYVLLITAGAAAGKLPDVLNIMRAQKRGAAPLVVVSRLVGAALAAKSPRLAAEAMALTNGRFARRYPLIAARVALAQGQMPETARLIQVAIDRSRISPADAEDITRRLMRRGQKVVARKVVDQIMSRTAPRGEVVLGLTELALKLDLEGQARTWLARVPAGAVTSWQKMARLLVAREVGQEDLQAAVPASLGRAERRLRLRQLQSTAQSAGRAALARQVQLTMASLSPKKRGAAAVAATPPTTGDPLKDMAALEPQLGVNAKIDREYADAIVRAVRAKQKVAKQVKRFLPGWVARADVPLADRRIIVDDLIALGRARLVVSALGPTAAKASKDVRELYAIALIESGRSAEARRVASSLIRGTPPGPALVRYADVADYAGASGQAKRALQRVLKKNPNNLTALRKLGFIASWSEQPMLARRLLTKYLKRRPRDWEAQHRLGEVIIGFPDWRRASGPYRRALAEIAKQRRPSLLAQRTRAHLYYRLGRFNDSIRAFRAILRRLPGDRETRKLFVDVLIAIGRYQQADRVKLAGRRTRKVNLTGEAGQ